jgi:FSR family fosmidomycin resistance protein-like MFS transporter
MAALSSGHLATDLAQGALPALLPFLKDEFGLSYAMAAALVLGSTFASSIIQPAFGLWSDARGALWLLPTGVAISGVFMGLAAIAPSYALALLCVLVSGVGVAAYHPEGSKFASYVSGARRASGMSLFSIGGNIGFALGPLLAAAAVGALGLRGGLLVMVPGIVVASLLCGVLRYLARFAPDTDRAADARSEPGQPKALTLLLAVVGLRALAHMGLFTFVPLWEVAKGNSKVHGTVLLSMFLFSGAVGTVVGGPAADRFGRRPVVVSSLAAATPLILVYVLAGGIVGGVALVLAGAFVIGTFGVTLVMSQEYLPGRVGMASGLSIGLAIGLGGVAAVTLGAIADAIDLRTAVLLTAVGPAFGVVLTLLLPPSRRARLVEPEPAPSTL